MQAQNVDYKTLLSNENAVNYTNAVFQYVLLTLHMTCLKIQIIPT